MLRSTIENHPCINFTCIRTFDKLNPKIAQYTKIVKSISRTDFEANDILPHSVR